MQFAPTNKAQLKAILIDNFLVMRLDDIDVSAVTDMSDLFVGLDLFLQHQNISKWNTSNVTNMRRMFVGCSTFNQTLNWDTSKVTDMSSMFADCTAFDARFGDKWDTSKVTNMHGMFNGCGLFTQSLNMDTSNVTNMSRMFQGCTVFDALFGPDWDTSKVIDMSCMFARCTTFKQEIAFSTRDCQTMARMFDGATNMHQRITMIDTSNVVNVDNMFDNSAIVTDHPGKQVVIYIRSQSSVNVLGNFIAILAIDSQYLQFDADVEYLATYGHKLLDMLNNTNEIWQNMKMKNDNTAAGALDQVIMNQGDGFVKIYKRAKQFIIDQYQVTNYPKRDNEAALILDRITGVVDLKQCFLDTQEHVVTAGGATSSTSDPKKTFRLRF